jgi:hypothetical protein
VAGGGGHTDLGVCHRGPQVRRAAGPAVGRDERTACGEPVQEQAGLVVLDLWQQYWLLLSATFSCLTGQLRAPCCSR